MTMKNTKMLIVAAAVVTIILSGYGIADAVQPDYIKQKIQDKVPIHLQGHVTKIFDLAREKNNSSSQSEIDSLNAQMQNEKNLMKEANDIVKAQNAMSPQMIERLESAKELIYADSELPLTLAYTNHNKLIIMLQGGYENQGWESYIRDLLPNNVNTKITYSDFEEWGCSSRNSECSPLLGGLAIREGNASTAYCTLGLPVQKGGNPGYLTAAHCYGLNDVVSQPYQNSGWGWDWEIGSVIDRDYDINSDNAFIDDSNWRGEQSKVWMESWYWTDIDSTHLPAKYDIITISGAEGDWYYGTVVSNNANVRGTINFDNAIILSSIYGGAGDSGASAYDWSQDSFIGIVKGGDGAGSIVVVPWSRIASDLGVSLLP